jgi:hypothetical protein
MENKLIEWFLDDVMGELKRISLVSVPAIDEEFLLFNTDLQFSTIDATKRIVTGAAMRPDIHIPRKDENGELYYGFFSKDTVRKAAELFFKNNSNANKTNLEHQFEVDGVYVYESWIVEDPKMDKAIALGFTDVREGDWFVSMKVDNDEVWNNYLKTGLIRGFSVEVKASEKDVELLDIISELIDFGFSDEDTFEIIEDLFAVVGPRGGIVKAPKAPKSSTPNPDKSPKPKAKGSAKNTRGAEVPKEVEEALQKKSDDFNERYKEKLGYGVTIGQLKTVYQRGVGAFAVSHSPKVSSQQQWAYARVNAYLYLVKNGRPENPKYVNDNDLLPTKHPKK